MAAKDELNEGLFRVKPPTEANKAILSVQPKSFKANVRLAKDMVTGAFGDKAAAKRVKTYSRAHKAVQQAALNPTGPPAPKTKGSK